MNEGTEIELQSLVCCLGRGLHPPLQSLRLSPDPDHVHVGRQSRGEERRDVARRGSSVNNVERNDVGALHQVRWMELAVELEVGQA